MIQVTVKAVSLKSRENKNLLHGKVRVRRCWWLCARVLLEVCFSLAHEGCSHVSLCSRDLSETAISQMPTLGLKELEILRLQDTDSLKKFPSIYNFEVSCLGVHSKTACHRVESTL